MDHQDEAEILIQNLIDLMGEEIVQQWKINERNFIGIRDVMVALKTHKVTLPYNISDELYDRIEKMGDACMCMYLYSRK